MLQSSSSKEMKTPAESDCDQDLTNEDVLPPINLMHQHKSVWTTSLQVSGSVMESRRKSIIDTNTVRKTSSFRHTEVEFSCCVIQSRS